ncbi:MBL fold metallo-hydrolase [Oscillibacter sp.]|uniref:MBL fold metallo-hydrolase n=1 Tax=Oscillibacter sp. TaxID=1945593 RepID=UPI00260FC929|nr:MBL fold metallo-hydrolase [Oscillibacter sp.]MDD3346368.1 MBL fold metallo-hydrolase [Oscillibacter sp.]
MIRVTFLAHSGFLLEYSGFSVLFDWWKGELPPLPEGKPLLVCASHHHPDHFNPAIFALDDGRREVSFLLGRDIRLTARNQTAWAISQKTVERCRRVGGGETVEALPGVFVETLPSTDEGVAFLVTAEGRSVFHAGDLNWWHWEGEEIAWNRTMETDFKRYTQPLQARHLDLAMLALDPRLGEDAFRGPRYFLESAKIDRFLPMHQWEEFGFTEKFLAACPAFASQTVPVKQNGQQFSFDD